MTWIHRYLLRHYLSDTIWIGPSIGIAAAMVTSRLTHAVDNSFGWEMRLDADAARTVLVTLAGAMLTFAVFVSSALLIALQLASAQLTPRIIAFVFRDPVTKGSLSVFVFTFTLTTAAVLRIERHVPALTVYLATYGCVASLALFIYLIDHIGKMLRPANALRAVAVRGRQVIRSVYPETLAAAEERQRRGPPPLAFDWPPEDAPRTTVVSRKDGVLLAIDIEEIVEAARRADCVIELVPQVGDFVAREDPLFHIYYDAEGATSHDLLRRTVGIGQERSMEQDPSFAFRIIVDIGSKALSAAINDPTTAVLAIDQLQHLLALVAKRNLDDERVRGRDGRVRLVYRTPGWEDFTHLAVTEVRQYGCQSIQVTRRLAAMLDSLVRTVPPRRAGALLTELDLLKRTVARSFPERADRAMAAKGDSQGVGGRHLPDSSSDGSAAAAATPPSAEGRGAETNAAAGGGS